MWVVSKKVIKAVTPAKAGVQNSLVFLDSGLRRNDEKTHFLTSCERINIDELVKSPPSRHSRACPPQ